MCLAEPIDHFRESAEAIRLGKFFTLICGNTVKIQIHRLVKQLNRQNFSDQRLSQNALFATIGFPRPGTAADFVTRLGHAHWAWSYGLQFCAVLNGISKLWLEHSDKIFHGFS